MDSITFFQVVANPLLAWNYYFLNPTQVVINVPVFKDAKTPAGHLEEYPNAESQSAAKEGHIYMDAMGFGMGLSCLQVTFQATDMSCLLYTSPSPRD